ncbi:hypothetical protein AUEXF2481DRAFT_32535 [Aureobasidium subglaciale EXF-2481]|uniref:DUF1446-domain-containing protein n=1 Tax=Aureobasidium subglaciale (strain EXF-2481) TaxID=1043005 RepID=A0A074Y2M5_AURSE|nr:uncharacterized protein AUEXF2481DRAFT_32535 [Aureobasidium subglaciale EXF-2481]KAI5207227.1 DUF1446-domain-containing protein [Aureobasidium subglaciale]KAI5226196.1 DUF1446-domain-containing protein [Aureobasidium subglaciale]KAI5229548.1 DUF1446-domain-containing protein [Aureobasidium subglaciale]KAI5264167.1 DUF1446-domain-containing protein [Aureobasidium subglaciale]KEQ92053.1 hypothetical protein AUEXF2481DRAFT_32535 [Aureobasidium subglaciale EXF-2481]
MPAQRNLRIGNCSGATGDAPHAMARMVRDADVDVITGDWLSEMNIAWESIKKAEDPELGYDVGFLRQLTECIDDVAEKKTKIITNAGAMNAPVLARRVEELCRSRGHDLVVATILGDDVSHLLTRGKSGERVLDFPHLDHQEQLLKDWDAELEPTCAAAYIGAWGIVAALKEGADIIICGRVTDASPVIGAAAWWYGWSETSYDQLAGALIAGHLIECGPYATGANFSGFKQFLPELVDLAFPMAEITLSGTCYITKPDSMNGVVNKFNITSQLLYELQGQMYLNPDVVADIASIRIEETVQKDRVFVSGCKGSPPPPTTKVMIAAPGGWQAETTYYINGLDVHEKAQMMKQQLQNIFGGSQFSKFSVELYGTQAENPTSQQAGTVMLRVFAQARRREDITAEKFKIPLYSLRMQSYPGYHMNLDFRTMEPKMFYEIFPATIPQVAINHEAVVASKTISIAPPRKTQYYANKRPSSETAEPVDLEYFGPAVRRPLGSIVHARSGDKADNSNIGFFVLHKDEYAWLQSLLTVDRLKGLLQDDYAGHAVERCEFPNILAIHL